MLFSSAPFYVSYSIFLLYKKLFVSVKQKTICMPAQFAAERQRAEVLSKSVIWVTAPIHKQPRINPNTLQIALFRQNSAYQSWQAPACLHFLHRIFLEIFHISSPSEFCRSRFLSDRGKTATNPAGFARILTKSRRKSARQNRVRICSRLLRRWVDEIARSKRTLSCIRSPAVFINPTGHLRVPS